MAPEAACAPPALRWRRRGPTLTSLTPARRLAVLLAAAAPTATLAWLQFTPTNTAPWCHQAASPRWPFAYSRLGDAPGSWEPKGRTTAHTTSFGHTCALRGARSTCHVCEPFACGPAPAVNDTCALQLQGADWAALPVNVPIVTDAPFAVGPAVRHRYDFGAAGRACVFLSGGGCLRAGGLGGLTNYSRSACALRCWSPWTTTSGTNGTFPPLPTATGWQWPTTTSSASPQGGVGTLAGGGGAGYADAPLGADATARFAAPQSTAIDPATGVTFVADADNHVIRAVSPDGAVTTVAGQPGRAGFADGPAATALFSSPAGVATYRDCGVRLPAPRPPVAPGGPCATALVVADTFNHRIRLVDLAAGVVSTLAGGGGGGGGGGNASDPDASPFGLADGPGAAARLDSPMGVAADDAGNVFVADTRNAAVRWVNATGHVRTLVGTAATPAPRELPGCPPPCVQGRPGAVDGALSVARLTAPFSVSLGPGAPYSLLVADGHALRQVTRAGQDPWAVVRPPHHALPVPGVTGGGTVAAASDADILSFDTLVTLAGDLTEGGDTDGDGLGGDGTARLDTPRGVAASLPDGRVYVADAVRCRLRVVTAASVAAAPVGCATRGDELVAPPGCASADPPMDSQGRMATALRADARYNAGGSSSSNSSTSSGSTSGGGVFDGAAIVPGLDGRRVPFCLGAPPPDLGNSSTPSGTATVTVDVDEDTWAGSTRLVVCPPACMSGGGVPAAYAVYGNAGSGYDTSSPVCAAAVHAGALDDATGGVLTVTYAKGAGPLAGRGAAAATGLPGATRNGVTSLPLLVSARTFTVAAVGTPTQRMIVETVAGSPAAPLESACGFADGSPPTAARFDGPAGIALDRDAPLSAGNPLRVADAHNHAVRTLSPPCALPCENGGVCVGTDVCACAPGWASADCTAPVCSAPCGPRRLCTGPDECSCVPGYGGASCDVPLCMQTCAHGGACVAPDTCGCAPGWFDANCTTPVCAQTCGNGGNCTAPDTCTCPAWWSGYDCRTPVCAQGCSGHGACTAPNTCTCDPSWSGHDCSKPVCHQGYFRADADSINSTTGLPTTYAPPGSARPRYWEQFLPCDYGAWCAATGEFECRQAGRRAGIAIPAPYPLQRNVSGWAAPPPAVAGTGGCIVLELDVGTRYPYRLQDERGGVSPYARLSALSQYGWGPPGAHPWSAPRPAANDRQIALVSFARVPQGVYVCAHGGACTRPDYCVCAPGWGGFECRTPVCAQGFYYPRDYLSPGRFADARFPEQGVYLPSTRTLSLWEHPPTPGGKFATGYMHAHPSFHSLPKDADPSAGLADAFTWVAGLGNDTNEGWRRDGWYVRARAGGAGGGLIPWQRGNPAVMAPRYARACDPGAPPPIDLRTGAPPGGPVDDTLAAFGPRATYNDSAVASSGGWWNASPAGAECVDAVRLGCFNGGACVAPDTCACAPGWTGVDCTLPLCPQATGVVTAASPPDVPLTLVRAGNASANTLPASAPPGTGDALVAYYTCPHGGNCTHPGVCTCEKGWGGRNCSVPLCAQECLNGGVCTAPDVCTCAQWPSTARDARGVPAYRKPDGSPQDSGWTGYDCGTPVCVQAAGWVPNDDTGRRLVVLEGGAANDGKSFQGGCGPGISRFAVSASRVSPRYLCGLTKWWMGNYRDPAANDDDDANPSAPSRTSAGRVVRVNTPNYVRANATGAAGGGGTAWVAGPPLPGEGIYACAHGGACVAPDSCACADGWSGPDCATPLCRHVGANNVVTAGCANGGVCAGKDTCACPTVPSLLWQVHPAAPRGAVTGWAGSNCTKPICAQGTFQEACRLPSDGSDDPGCWVCPHGGNCTAPDTCACPPAWAGYDCTTPVCTLHASTAIRAQLATRDPDKVTSFEQDPCGARQRVALPDGRHVPRGSCVAPGVCECLCKRRAVGGERPWVDPLGRPIPPGFVHGAGDCLDGYTGATGPDGTTSSCHLAIYVPTWLERNTEYLAAFSGVGAGAGVLLYLLARRQLRARHRRLKAARRRRRQQLVVPGAVGGGAGGGPSDGDDNDSGDGAAGGRRRSGGGGAGASAARSRRHSASTGAFTARFKWASEPVAPAPPEGEEDE